MGKAGRLRIGICFAAFLLLLPAQAFPQDRALFSVRLGECNLTVDANERWHTLRLRVHPETRTCLIEKGTMLAALKGAFSKTGPPIPEGPYSSLYIGRLIDYPWLSQYLADTAARDGRWDRKRGKTTGMDINRYVSNLLFRKEVTGPVEEALSGGGYKVVSVTVEKVLVGSCREVPLYRGKPVSGKVPYDAQVWFRLAKD